MAILGTVAKLDLTDDQRTKLNTIRSELKQRQSELLEKIAVASLELQKTSKEHFRASQSLSDLKGHLMFANMDAANRAEEMLTDEQRQSLMRGGSHVMTPEQLPDR
jgi:hypothetical protein